MPKRTKPPPEPVMPRGVLPVAQLPMSNKEFRAITAFLFGRYSREITAEVFKIDPATVTRYRTGKASIPLSIALTLRLLMLAHERNTVLTQPAHNSN